MLVMITMRVRCCRKEICPPDILWMKQKEMSAAVQEKKNKIHGSRRSSHISEPKLQHNNFCSITIAVQEKTNLTRLTL